MKPKETAHAPQRAAKYKTCEDCPAQIKAKKARRLCRKCAHKRKLATWRRANKTNYQNQIVLPVEERTWKRFQDTVMPSTEALKSLDTPLSVCPVWKRLAWQQIPFPFPVKTFAEKLEEWARLAPDDPAKRRGMWPAGPKRINVSRSK